MNGPRFLCPWCGIEDTEETGPVFRSVQRTEVEHVIRINNLEQNTGATFDYTGQNEVYDEGADHEYYRCTNCQHFFIEQAGNGLNVPIKCHEDADFALLLAASGELDDVDGPDGWDPVVDGASVSEEFWESAYATERECWKALRRLTPEAT